MVDGIYTLANDAVFDQLVALLNSIEAHAGDLPVCVVAYNNQVERVQAELAHRPQVQLLNDSTIFQRWEEFSAQVWQAHPHALQTWQTQKGITGVYRLECNHRYAAFDLDAPFDRFVYLDADTLLLDALAPVFEALNTYDFVTYDFQYKDPSHIFNVASPQLYKIFERDRLERNIFCSGFFASKTGLFPPEKQAWLVEQLAQGEADILYLAAPNQSVLNYITMRSPLSMCNLAFHLPPDRVTGNSVTSPHFEERDRLLYDHGKRLMYLHYIGLSSKLFRQVCEGENVDFPYRDVFLHYRYLHEPNRRPILTGKPKPYNAPPSLTQRLLRKIGLTR